MHAYRTDYQSRSSFVAVYIHAVLLKSFPDTFPISILSSGENVFLTNHSDPRPQLTGCSFTRWLEQSKKVFDRKWVNAEPLTWARTHVLMRDSHNAFRNHWIELTFSQEVNYKSDRFIYDTMDSKRLLSRDTCSVPRGNPMLPRLLDLQPHTCQDYRVIKVREDSRQNNLDFTPHTQQTSSN